MDNRVAKLIYGAQYASDRAKGIKILPYEEGLMANYSGKDIYILRAIHTIVSKKDTGCSFYVTIDEEMSECRECTHFLVYFDFNLGVEHFQVSFHSLNGALKRYLKKEGTRHSVSWDEKSSRDACVLLHHLYMGTGRKEDRAM